MGYIQIVCNLLLQLRVLKVITNSGDIHWLKESGSGQSPEEYRWAIDGWERGVHGTKGFLGDAEGEKLREGQAFTAGSISSPVGASPLTWTLTSCSWLI